MSILAVFATVVSVTVGSLWSAASGVPLPEAGFERAGIQFNLLLLGFALGVSVVTGVLAPRWWRRVALALAALPVPVLLYTSRNFTAALILLALILPACWLGREAAARLFGEDEPGAAWSVGAAFGLIAVAALGFATGMVELLRAPVIWSSLAIVTALLLATGRRRLRADLAGLVAWWRQPVERNPARSILVGAAITVLWLNLIGALAPEVASDAVRQRTVTAAHFAATGRLAADDPELSVARDPALGEIVYAVGLTIGPLQTAKLLHFLVGLGCAATIYVLGQRLGGREAGGVAAFAFYTMPLVAWLSQTAYLDLFTTLFATTAALILAHRDAPDHRAAIAAGICLGGGIAVKVHFGYVAVGLALMLGVLVLRRHGVGAALRLSAILTVVALLVAAPWLIRSFLITGQVPGLGLGVQSLTRASGAHPAILSDLPTFGYSRSPVALARAPFDLTFRSMKFEWLLTPSGPYTGYLGYLPLGLVPLLPFVRIGRWRVFATLLGAVGAFLLWFYTAQYLRYGLPIFALLCPLGGAAYAAVRRRTAAPRAILAFLLLSLGAAGVGTQLRVPSMGYQYVLGREDRAAHLTRYLFCCGGYKALRLLETEPGITRVFAPRDPARLYTPARISSLSSARDILVDGDDELVLARLRAGGYSHIIIDRGRLPAGWETISVLNEEFLRRNTILIGGGDNAYLYRLLPPEERGRQHDWAQGHELLLNGGFETAGGGLPLDWDPFGSPRYDCAGITGQAGRCAILGTSRDGLSSSTTVIPGRQYLLSHATRAAAADSTAQLRLEWRDSAGQIIRTDLETVPASTRAYHARSMLATAPPNAVTATVRLSAGAGEVWFDDISLRPIAPT